MIKNRGLILKNNLKRIRKVMHITQSELAAQVGVSRQTINAIENGIFCPTALLAALLCKVLEKSFEEVFELEWRDNE